MKSLKNRYPRWIFTTKEGQTFAYRNVQCVADFKVAVRIGLDGLVVFGKNGYSPNLFFMNPIEFASLEDFKESSGKGFRSFEIGCVRLDGNQWFSDCIYKPGLIEADYEEIKSLLSDFFHNYHSNRLPTEKQINRIKKMIDLRGEEFVRAYFYSKFSLEDFNNMGRESAQKVITGLQWIEPRKPLSNVHIHSEWIS